MTTTLGNVVYIGDYNEYGKRHGPGEIIWDNGDVYVGDFFHGNRHGHGTLTFADGSEYTGEWECNEMHGQGIRTYANGTTYHGSYRHGKRHGFGKLAFANGDLYVGHFDQDQMHSAPHKKSKYHYGHHKHGIAVVECVYVHGIRQGLAKMQYASGDLDLCVYDAHGQMSTHAAVRWNASRTSAHRCKWSTKKSQWVTAGKLSIPAAVSLGYQLEQQGMAVLGQSLETITNDNLVAVGIPVRNAPPSPVAADNHASPSLV